MKVKVLAFGALADLSKREETYELRDGATVTDLVVAVRERYPAASEVIDKSRVAVNLDFVDREHQLGATDEVAILPPMSGGAIDVRLSAEPSVDRAIDAIREDTAGAVGATVTFVGTVRDSCDLGPVDRLEYTAYDDMAVKVMDEIAREASDKWSLGGVAIDHTLGVRPVGSTTFVVACAAPRRDEAFDACRYVVDEVKQRVPIWKKEFGPWGSRWLGL